MKTTELLLENTKDIWEAYNQHDFVLGIQNGTLDKEKFKYYIIQDYIYLIDYARVFAIGLAKAKSPETMKFFNSYVQLLVDGELNIHKGYMGKFSVTEAELRSTPTALDNLSYTSYMLRVAYEEGEEEILAAILSCAYSYEIIAANILKNNPRACEHEFYGDWVKGYSAESYSRANAYLMDMLDRLTNGFTDEQKKHLSDIFVACSRYEMAFWDLAWSMSK